ncbi:oleoyl-acyl carrier protein thioesterase, chloroplastic-like protein, partial [Tanacetum coccineum]
TSKSLSPSLKKRKKKRTQTRANPKPQGLKKTGATLEETQCQKKPADSKHSKRNIQLADLGSQQSPPKDGTRETQLLPEGTSSVPSDLGSHKKLIDEGTPKQPTYHLVASFEDLVVAASYAELHANVEEFCNESLNARAQIHMAINTIMKFIENEQKDHHSERTSILESLSKVQESLKEDSELKARLKTLNDNWLYIKNLPLDLRGLEPMITEIIEKTEPKSIKELEVTKEPKITEPKFTKEPQDSKKDHYDLDPEPQMIEYKLPNERVAKLTRDEVAELIEKEEKVKNKMLSKYKIVKVAAKEVTEAEHVISDINVEAAVVGGGIGVLVGLVVVTMFSGGDGELVVCGGGGVVGAAGVMAMHPNGVTVGLVEAAEKERVQLERGDVVEIETWPQRDGRIGIKRDWIIKDFANGEFLGRATSKWVMMNVDTRRLRKVSDDVINEYLASCPKALRLAFPDDNNNSLKKIAKLEIPAAYSRLGLMPRRADLDMNKHVNNVTHIGWALESVPQEVNHLTLGLKRKRKPVFPKHLQERFGKLRYHAADPPDFLNYQGCEFLLISASDNIREELGVDVHEDSSCSDLINTFGALMRF